MKTFTVASSKGCVKRGLVNWPLIGVEDLGPPMKPKCVFQRLDAELGVHRV